jgi:hypothetical protein
MNTPAVTYVRRSVFSCVVPLLFIPILFVVLGGAAGQYPLTLRAVANSLLVFYWVALVCMFGAWAIVVLPTMLWVPPHAWLWRIGPAILIGALFGLLSMVFVMRVPPLSELSLTDAFFFFSPFLAAGAAVGFLAHRSMTPKA